MTKIKKGRRHRYDQLSPAAQRKAVEQVQRWLNDDLNNGELGDFMQEILNHKYGMYSLTTLYSLGHCQGDGVAMEGTIVLHEEVLEKDDWLRGYMKNLAAMHILSGAGPQDFDVHAMFRIEVTHEGRYTHWNSMRVWVEQGYQFDGDDVLLDDTCREIKQHFEERMKEISRHLEKFGYDYIENATSDESAFDAIMVNKGWRWRSDGQFA